METIKVAQWGFGAMGQGMAKMLLGKRGVEIVGICDAHPARVGRGMREVLGVNSAQADVLIRRNIDEVVAERGCDICIIATDSFVKHVADKVIAICEKGVNVITIAEEMSWPRAQNAELADKMDAAARRNGVSVLGTGINPGLVMDLLAVLLSACMTDVQSVQCRRVNSLSPFGVTVMEEQGIGMEVDEFDRRVTDGSLAGHVGFAESIGMIDAALGLDVDAVETQMEAIVTEVNRKSPHGFAAAGQVAGVNMTGQGLRGGQVVIDMIHPQQIEPHLGGTHTGDYIVLSGSPGVDMAIRPEIEGGLGTIAMCVNCIPHVINAEPGLKTMLDIPVPHAIMGDFRDFVREGKRIVQ
ncbi:MAG: 2,4-diaminopentanoate dehydrogenase [Clostridiales bacterium]|nr:2,4-diaminopentanoate dehydrogenase [Clostridiales bacterium]